MAPPRYLVSWLAFCPLVRCSLNYPMVDRQYGVPSYVTRYAPIAYLFSNETHLPSDFGAQLDHTHPTNSDNQTITGAPDPLSLDNLDQLNAYANGSAYLTSNEGIEAQPPWFDGVKPTPAGVVEGATTCAVIVADKGNGTTDVFYFYFYAYNEGNEVDILGEIDLGEFGDHVGDWEHSMIRFSNGVPQTVYLSEHDGGSAFTYAAMEKDDDGVRPIIYIGNGTHANWAITGDHDHTITGVDLPFDLLLTDHTDAGVLYDPIQSAYFYTYNVSTGEFAAFDDSVPVNWLYFTGMWGDEQLPDDAPGQVILFGQAKYSSGPTGPEDKNLNRTDVCESNPCSISSELHA